jgi:hypothetical protein
MLIINALRLLYFLFSSPTLFKVCRKIKNLTSVSNACKVGWALKEAPQYFRQKRVNLIILAFHYDFINPHAVHIYHFKIKIIPFHGFAFFWQFA